MPKRLEEIIEEKRQKFIDRTSEGQREYVADTVSRLTSFVPIMAPVEYFIVGMESEEVLKARLAATALAFVIGYPHGKWRQICSRLTKTKPSSKPIRKISVDFVASVTFGVCAYTVAYLASGAPLEDAPSAYIGTGFVGACVNMVYGKWNDGWRKFLGAPPVMYDDKDNPGNTK